MTTQPNFKQTCMLFRVGLTAFLLLFINGILLSQGVKGTVISGDLNEPVLGASVVIEGTSTGTITQEDGSFELSVSPGNYNLQFKFVGYSTLIIPIEVSGVTITDIGSVTLEPDLLGLDEVVVLGTRRSNRTVTESSVPIDIISAREVEATGFTQTVEVIQTLVPSFNTQKNSITDATDYIRPAQLRGLGPEHVLILVNGKRRHISSVVHDNEQARGSVNVDLNSIPPAAIERIEVLRDGAAAQYGSDAIAGVINIVLKKSTDFDVSVSYGQNMSKEQRGYNAGESLNGEHTDATLMSKGYYVNWVDTTYDKFHTDGQSYTAHLSKGFNVGKGSVHVSAQIWKQGKSSRNGIDPDYQYWGDSINGGLTYNPAAIASPVVDASPLEATIDRENWWFGKSEMTDISTFINAAYPTGKESQFYVFGGYSWREGCGPCFWRQPGSNNTVRTLKPDGYLPNVKPVIKDYSTAVGYEGVIGNWDFDLSQTIGYNNFNFKGTTLNVSLGNPGDQTARGRPDLEAKDFFDGGGTKFTQLSTNIDLSREIEANLASPLYFAIGGEFRHESYEIYAGEPAAWENGLQMVKDGPNAGAQPAIGTQCVQAFHRVDEVDATRSNVAIYADAEADLMKSLTFGIAGRFENYSDFGNTFTGKISGRLELTEGIAIRAAASTGFRAPALQQQYYSNRSLQAEPNGDLKQTGSFPVGNAVSEALGAKSLEPEKSTNISGGITVNYGNFSLSADAYHILLNDRIILSEKFKGADATRGAAYSALLDSIALNVIGGDDGQDYLGIQLVNYFTNALDTRTQGIDVVMRYVFKIKNTSSLRLTGAANFTQTRITNKDEISTPEKLKPYTDQELLGHTNRNNIEQAAPSTMFNFIVNYNIKNFNTYLKFKYFGKITAAERFAGDDPLNDQSYDGKLINDLEVSYAFMEGNLKASLGANNLFNIYPEKRYKSQSRWGILPYSGYVPYGFTGRYVYVRVQYHLKGK
ncbi:MAG: TonB-dependent receptor [Bacteroidales bacterium]|nr:TonB-dependent receptor [Bacteroidales bacterium]